ncbi:MAG TPA: hypothetical protein VIJ29_02020 [Candidatus Paceibacterota bacterium]
MQIFLSIVTAYLILFTLVAWAAKSRVVYVGLVILAGLGATDGIVRLSQHPSTLSALIAEICIILVIINAFRARSASSSP